MKMHFNWVLFFIYWLCKTEAIKIFRGLLTITTARWPNSSRESTKKSRLTNGHPATNTEYVTV